MKAWQASDKQQFKARWMARGAVLLAALAAAGAAAAAEPAAEPPAKRAVFQQPTYSSPIALSADNRLLWSVNPGDDSVSVLRTDNNTVLKKIKVGREPQSVALDPNNKFAFVANAAGSSVTVIKIINAKHRRLRGEWSRRRIKTGAEPWNIVSSPDGKRVFVANSGQDTITVINALSHAHHRPGQPAQQPVQRPRPQPPLPAARAGGEPGQQATVRHPLPVVHQAGRRGGGRRGRGGPGLPPRHQHQRQRHRRLPAGRA